MSAASIVTDDTVRVIYNDGVYGVTMGLHTVLIAKQDGAGIHIPRGHAWFDRVAEADSRRAVEDLHTELVGLMV